MIAATYASQINQLVGGDAACLRSDSVSHLTAQQAICELAGRICYRSTAKMGHAPGFLLARMTEGHQDIFEHVWITAVLVDDDDAVNRMEEHRYVWVTRTEQQQWCYVSANMRVWLEMAQSILVARNVLVRYMPNWQPTPDTTPDPQWEDLPQIIMPERIVDGRSIANMVGYHRPNIAVGAEREMHWAATFLLQNVSRALTHQLVRHRLLSFSQESQRYVSLDAGGWTPIVPPAIAANDKAQRVVDRVWQSIEDGYEQLRELGMRKEDARYLLPNATSTTIMVSGSIAAWRGMLHQRCASDAQWEIRGVALAIKEMLVETGMYHD